jgi:hypothetical protein
MARLVERWRASGLTARAFSTKERIPEARLWYWKRRTRGSESPAFLPVQIVPEERTEEGAVFELFFGDGRRLRIPPELTGPALRRLLSTLRAC